MNDIQRYYGKKESRWGYRLLLKGVRHSGYYPERRKTVSHRKAQELMVERVAANLELPQNSKILDAGCGEGVASIVLATQYGYEVKGIDLLPESINRAQKHAARNQISNVEFKEGDYNQLSFDDNSFDGVFTLETLVHSSDISQTLAEFKRVLKPGGVLVLHEYTIQPLEGIPDTGLCDNLLAIIKGSGMHGLIHFTHNSFEKRLLDNGFTKVQQENLTKNIMPMARYFKRLALPAYPLVKLFKKERKYPNITTGANGVKLIENDYFRYVTIRCQKPS